MGEGGSGAGGDGANFALRLKLPKILKQPQNLAYHAIFKNILLDLGIKK